MRVGIGASPTLGLNKLRDSVVVSRSVVKNLRHSSFQEQKVGIRSEGKRKNLSMAARLVPQPDDPNGLKFPHPIRSYDVHVYFWQTDAANTALAHSLREECVKEFPDLNIYKFWDKPIGPHPTGMFEVDIATPYQFSRFVPWMQVKRQGLSVLVHPNTGQELDDHTINAMWIGEKIALNTSCLSNKGTDYGLKSHGIVPSGTA